MILKDLRHFKKIDYLTAGYLILSVLLIAIFRNNIPNYFFYISVNSFFIVFIYILVSLNERNKSRFIHLIRDWYPVILYTILFEETGRINRTIFPDFIDKFFIDIEFRIFGFHPAIELGNMFDSLFIMEYFHFAYFTYYLIIPGLGFILYFSNKRHFDEYIFVNSLAFYTCLVTYIFLPVLGARYYANAPYFADTFWKEGILFVPIMRFIYSVGEVDGAAFPSSHVAVAVIILIYTYMYARKYFIPALIIIVSLIISTVYCRFHYVIDVFAGIIWAVAAFYTGRRIFYHSFPDKNNRFK